MLRKIGICIWIFLSSFSALSLDLSGSVAVRDVNYPLPTNGPVNSNLTQSEIHLIGEHEFSPDSQFKAHFIGVFDPSNNSTNEQWYADAPEFLWIRKSSNWILKVGTDVISWGVTDGDNPLDIVNSKVYFDPIHAQKIGAGSVQLNFSGDENQLDLIFIPWARSAILPGGNSRWLPRQIYTGQSGGQPYLLILPNSFSYSSTTIGAQSQADQNNWGARWQFHHDNWELATYFFDGLAPFPLITPSVSGTEVSFFPVQVFQINSAVNLQLQDYRQQVTGVSFVKSQNSWQFKGESAYTNPLGNAYTLKGAVLESVLAIEKNWNVGESRNLITILQYAYAQHSLSGSNDISSFSRFFDNNWMGIVRGTYRDTETFTAFYSSDQLSFAWFADLSYEHKWNDSLKTKIEVMVIDGPLSSPIGAFAANKSGAASLEYSF